MVSLAYLMHCNDQTAMRVMDIRTGVAATVGREAALRIVVISIDLATFDYRRNMLDYGQIPS
jgi:hypothetical protein